MRERSGWPLGPLALRGLGLLLVRVLVRVSRPRR